MAHIALRHNYSNQAFILHIWDDTSVPVPRDGDPNKYLPGWHLVNYLTHNTGAGINLARKMDFLAYIGSF